MAMPEFIKNVQDGAKNPTGWLTPATVAELLECDFHTMPPEQWDRLFQAVERFRAIAELPSPTSAQQTEARAALDVILEVLRPYLTPESQKIREAIWKAWRDRHDWIPTFDYEIGNNWTGDPVVWVWLIIKDDVDVEDPTTQERLGSIRLLIHKEFNESGIERWPNISVAGESEVKELHARATA